VKLEDLSEITELRNQREQAMVLRNAARDGNIGDLYFYQNGVRSDAFKTVSNEPVRSAVIIACEEAVTSIDKRLAQLGVRVPRFDETPATLEAWKRTAEMYARAWLRELGGKLIPKAHHIDALVLTTRAMRKKAEARDEPPPAPPPDVDEHRGG
jgi:hypothetical protein